MSGLRQLMLCAVLAVATSVLAAGATTMDLGDVPQAVVVGPGVISVAESHSDYFSMSPDGRQAVFTRLEEGYRGGTLFLADRVDGQWTDVRVAPFSGQHQDSRASFSPDGRRLFFASDRPHPDRQTGRTDLDIWWTSVDDGTWREPVRLGSAINTAGHESHPSQASSGALYFVRRTGDSDLWYAPSQGEGWQTAVSLDAVNSEHADSHVFVDPAERYLLFARIDPAADGEHDDVYISVREASGWTSPASLGPIVNTEHYDYAARVYGDPAVLYFTRNGQWTDGQPARILAVDATTVAPLRRFHDGR